MKYFVLSTERHGSCYYEFYKGTWDNKTFWKSDSIYLHDDVMYNLNIDKIFACVLTNYDPFGETEVTHLQWKDILKQAQITGGDTYAAILEADQWVSETFVEHNVFTILGI
jgi:hypothetical protein